MSWHKPRQGTYYLKSTSTHAGHVFNYISNKVLGFPNHSKTFLSAMCSLNDLGLLLGSLEDTSQ